MYCSDYDADDCTLYNSIVGNFIFNVGKFFRNR